MDSMRSLNRSLPGNASPSKHHDHPPEHQLLAAFKVAALSVTNLYKSAAAERDRARSDGFQDALDELLAYLDKEDIGLSDGEGWRIRRWATERLDGRDSVSQKGESDEETEKAERASSPILPRSQSLSTFPTTSTARTASPVRTDLAPPASTLDSYSVAEATAPTISQDTFTFRSQHLYPHDADTILADIEATDSGRTNAHDSNATSNATNNSTPGLPTPRTSRTRHSHPNRLNSRSTNPIGRGAGQKRKINFGEFFDISGDNSGGGGKRRHI